MKIKMFYHSLLSDWNHGNAHFLRGMVKALLEMGHKVEVFEDINNWSLQNLRKDYGDDFTREFDQYYPGMKTNFYKMERLDLSSILTDADLVIVHEWNSPELIKEIGEYCAEKQEVRLLFHDTHHRSLTRERDMAKYDLSKYDGVLAFGEVIRQIYLKKGWCKNVWTWHEGADTDLFRPAISEKEGDLVWIGNWGDEERTAELYEYLIEPVKELGLKARIYGVRYPSEALRELNNAGIEYGGYLPNYKAPEVFARFRFTVHVPRKPYREVLHGIPTIRPFEAMSCGIPLISAPWQDSEDLFKPGKDFLYAVNKREMIRQMERLLHDDTLCAELAENGRKVIVEEHSCRKRAEELMAICTNHLKMPVSLSNKTVEIL